MNYSEEEKEAIEYIEQLLYIKKEYTYIIKVKSEDNTKQSLQTVLNLIQKQDKIIDELKNHIYYKNCIACGKEFKAKRKDAKYCAYCSRSITNRAYYLSLTEEQKQKRREQAKLCMRRIRAERKVDNETV